jgi:hypothetical protein
MSTCGTVCKMMCTLIFLYLMTAKVLQLLFFVALETGEPGRVPHGDIARGKVMVTGLPASYTPLQKLSNYGFSRLLELAEAA